MATLSLMAALGVVNLTSPGASAMPLKVPKSAGMSKINQIITLHIELTLGQFTPNMIMIKLFFFQRLVFSNYRIKNIKILGLLILDLV